jgi:hypothetical protein
MDTDILMTIGGLVLTVVKLWILFAVKSFRDEMSGLRATDKDLGERVAAIQLLVAAQYVTRTEFQTTMREQTATILGRMEDITNRPRKGVA